MKKIILTTMITNVIFLQKKMFQFFSIFKNINELLINNAGMGAWTFKK